ncbi:hypothetical protein Pelo_9734 [Pelomyxa schiedti]|nr:hypothetical protein Pelo_9734 [Pelomyxa schiedti]
MYRSLKDPSIVVWRVLQFIIMCYYTEKLEQLEQQALDEQLAAVDEIPVKLPPVPTATPTPAKRKEEDELAALERSMAL